MVIAVFLVLAILLPSGPVAKIMAPQSGWPNVLSEEIGVFVILAIGLNVVVGQAGMLDLGYVGFYAVGGYTMALLADQAPLGLLVHPAGGHLVPAAISGPDPRRADPAAARRLPGHRDPRLRADHLPGGHQFLLRRRLPGDISPSPTRPRSATSSR